MTTLLAQFISESRDLLQQVTDALVRFEAQPADQALLNEIFRVIHTLKGNSGLFEFPQMTRVLHAGEDLLDALRDGKLQYQTAMVDQLLEATDFVVLLVDEIENEGQIAVTRTQTAQQITAALQAFNPRAAAAQAVETSNAVQHWPAGSVPLPLWISRVPLAMRPALDTAQLHWLQYQPEAECFFKGEDPLYLMQQCPGLVWFAVDYHPAQPGVADESLWDPYQCGLSFMALSTAEHTALQAHFRYVPEQIQCQPFGAQGWPEMTQTALDTWPQTTGTTCWTQLSSERQQVILEIFQAQCDVLQETIPAECFNGVLESVHTTCVHVLKSMHADTFQAQMTSAWTQATQSHSVTPLLQAIVSVWQACTGDSAPPLSELAGALAPTPTSQSATLHAAMPAIATPAVIGNEATQRTASRTEDTAAHKTLKVDQDKIDRMMNLIGEMVVAKNSLPYLAARAENQYGNRELAREIKNQYSVINRIAEEMQQSIMQIRMMPVSVVFQRFPRLVRDTCRKLDKQVNLVLEGEHTEADKLMIEALADPLIHIVRNSLDHGIERPEVRLQKGKPAQGQLTIRATQQTDSVLIEVIDDGKGIDPSVIKQKALEKGLVTAEAMARMTDQQAINLVFAAGFSTAEAVSDLSGRGVGMDVVRSAVERVNGQVSLESVVDRGTTLRLLLPLSMAITNVIVIESHQQQFGIPMDMVMETVRIPQQDIRQIKTSRAAMLRDRIVPLLSLNQLLGLEAAQQTNEQQEVATLVVNINNESIGLMVDAFKATADIILKPLPAILSGMKWYSGSAMMGDGSVLMVLNPKELVA